MRWVRTFLLHGFLVALVFLPVWSRGLLLAPDDGLNYFVPAFLSSNPIWDSWLFCGFPAFADPQTMLWYPLRHLPGGLSSWNVFVLSGFVLAAAFFHRWVADATKSELAGAVCGFAFAMSGYPMSHLRHVNVLHTAAWIPFVFFAVDRVTESPTSRRIALLAAGTAMAILAGHPQTMTILGLLAAAYAVIRGFESGSKRTRVLLSLAAGFALGLALAAVIVLPMVELSARSFRSLHLPDDSPPVPFVLKNFRRCFLTPFLRGGSECSEAKGIATEGFFGLAGTTLALFAVVRGGLRERCLAGFAVLAGVLALGEATPLGRAAIELPFFSMYRVPARFLALAHVAVLALAGTALATLDRLRGRRLVAGMAAALVVVEAAGFALFSEWRFGSVSRSEFERPAFLEPVHAELARTGQRLVPISGRLSPNDGAPPNRSALWGIPSPAGYNPLRSADVCIVFDLNSRAQIPWENVLGPHLAVDLAATRYVTARLRGPSDLEAVEGSGRWKKVDERGGITLFERTEPAPRAWLVPSAITARRGDALQAIRTATLPDGSAWNPRHVALVEEALAGPWNEAGMDATADSVTIELAGARVARVRTHSSGRRLLFVSETHDPGWTARVDGASAPILRANCIFLGVPLAPGDHQVELIYRPRILRVAGAVSAAALLAVLLLAFRRGESRISAPGTSGTRRRT